MIIKISKCPHCRHTLDFGINEPLVNPLGKPGYFLCPYCKIPISNGKTEWEDKTQIQKFSFIFRCVITIFWISALVLFFSIILIGAFPKIDEFLGRNGRLDSPTFILYALCTISCVSFWVIRTMKIEINESKRRNSKTEVMR